MFIDTPQMSIRGMRNELMGVASVGELVVYKTKVRLVSGSSMRSMEPIGLSLTVVQPTTVFVCVSSSADASCGYARSLPRLGYTMLANAIQTSIHPNLDCFQRQLPLGIHQLPPASSGIGCSRVVLAGPSTAHSPSPPPPPPPRDRSSFEFCLNELITDLVCSYCDMTGANLEGMDFMGARLTGCDLTNADLTGASFVGARFEQVTLDGAQLSMADFSDVEMLDVSMQDVVAMQVDFSDAILRGVTHATYANWQRSDFTGATFDHAALSYLDLSNARFVVAKMQVVHIEGCILDFVDFSATQLQFAELTNVHAKGVNFEFAQLLRSAFAQSDLERAVFVQTDLVGATFDSGTRLDCADFTDAETLETTFPCERFDVRATGMLTRQGLCSDAPCGGRPTGSRSSGAPMTAGGIRADPNGPTADDGGNPTDGLCYVQVGGEYFAWVPCDFAAQAPSPPSIRPPPPPAARPPSPPPLPASCFAKCESFTCADMLCIYTCDELFDMGCYQCTNCCNGQGGGWNNNLMCP